MTAATIAGSAATATACPTAHSAACRTLVTTTLETEDRENAIHLFGAAGGTGHRVCRPKYQSFELAIAAFAIVLVNRHILSVILDHLCQDQG